MRKKEEKGLLKKSNTFQMRIRIKEKKGMWILDQERKWVRNRIHTGMLVPICASLTKCLTLQAGKPVPVPELAAALLTLHLSPQHGRLASDVTRPLPDIPSAG